MFTMHSVVVFITSIVLQDLMGGLASVAANLLSLLDVPIETEYTRWTGSPPTGKDRCGWQHTEYAV